MKNQDFVDQYLDTLNIKLISDLNVRYQPPRFSSLLFFDFFKKTDQLSSCDVFKNLKLDIKKIIIRDTDLNINPDTAKTVIKFDIIIVFS